MIKAGRRVSHNLELSLPKEAKEEKTCDEIIAINYINVWYTRPTDCGASLYVIMKPRKRGG